jgi:hypothetical protein
MLHRRVTIRDRGQPFAVVRGSHVAPPYGGVPRRQDLRRDKQFAMAWLNAACAAPPAATASPKRPDLAPMETLAL